MRLSHGDTINGKTKEYRAWSLMRDRCTNAAGGKFDNYGGRGIAVWPPWESYGLFLDYVLATIGRAPSPSHSIDRVDNDGDYMPGNIRWATWTEQARNRRPRKPTAETCRRCGAPYVSICNRRKYCDGCRSLTFRQRSKPV